MARHDRNHYPHLLTCSCGKVWAGTKNDARRIRKEIVTLKQHETPCRFYECESGGWHWTQQVEKGVRV